MGCEPTQFSARQVAARVDAELAHRPVQVALDRADRQHEADRLYGISEAGYWVPRALASEHRIAAGIVDPGVWDAFAPWWNALSPPLRRALDAGDHAEFDRLFQEGLDQAPPAYRRNWLWRAKPYGTTSPFEVFVRARRYTLGRSSPMWLRPRPWMTRDPERGTGRPFQADLIRFGERTPASASTSRSVFARGPLAGPLARRIAHRTHLPGYMGLTVTVSGT